MTGASCVAILVVRKDAEILAAFLGIVAFGFSAYALVTIAGFYERIDAAVYAFVFMLGGGAGGWALASSFLERLAAKPDRAASPERLPEARAGVAVIIFACVESLEYDPVETARILQRLVDDEIIAASVGTLPFLFFAEKARYRAIGGRSPAYAELAAISDTIGDDLRGVVTRCDHATCAGERSLARRILAATRDGYRILVVAELTAGDSLALSDAKRQTDALHLDALGVRVSYTTPVSQSERIVEMLVSRVLNVTDEPASTGVVLLGHGQTDAQARENPVFDEQETALLSRVRMQLVEHGLSDAHMRVAWAEWRSPDLTSSVRHLAALGCRRIVVVPGTFPLDTISTRLDLELAVRQARVDSAVSVVTLPAWSNDAGVIEELEDRITAEIRS